MKMAKLLASKPPLALRAAKEAIHKGVSMTLEQGLDLERDCFSYLCGTEDQKEGAAAFIERRLPVFKGR
jgi:enoyl-CoA hydratase